MTLLKFNTSYHYAFVLLVFIFCPFLPKAQEVVNQSDSVWHFHFQTTDIFQYHPQFKALYRGSNSLNNRKETTFSSSATFFFDIKLGKKTILFFDPEISGGKGFSGTTGIAGFPNGEVYRISDTKPHGYIARAYYKQIIPIHNSISSSQEKNTFFLITVGKFSMMDFFDNNQYSHDPRTQFYNWALMGNGAWDYPANTRGYTYGLETEYITPQGILRYAITMMPKRANDWIMDPQIGKANGQVLEFEKPYFLNNQKGVIRVFSFLNQARMGSYGKAIAWGKSRHTAPAIDSVQIKGNTKYGFGLNIEQQITPEIGFFSRIGWNDGHNETWAFTEIDRTFSAGISMNGSLWKRDKDSFGMACLLNELSQEHKEYLKQGGDGFIIGDGQLNYSPEIIFETYYSFNPIKIPLTVSPDYQFILHPAYNKDRGPVHAIGIRMHFEI